MLRDEWGSDMDYDAYFQAYSLDQRDDWCEKHGQRGTTCGPCYADAMQDDEHVWWTTSAPQDDDEMGADLAARFSPEDSDNGNLRDRR